MTLIVIFENRPPTFGFLGDPVMQAADIFAYKASAIPVGADQVDHPNLTQEIAKRFNALYGNASSVFPAPQPYLTADSRLPGIDGDKMSKSYGNAIFLRSSTSEIQEKVDKMSTNRNAPEKSADVTDCPVFKFHTVYSSVNDCSTIKDACHNKTLSCVDCKQPLVDLIESEQAPIRQRAEEYLSTPTRLEEIVSDGCNKARQIACKTLEEVRDVMGLRHEKPDFSSC